MSGYVLGAGLIAAQIASPTNAFPAKHLLEDMDAKERFVFLSGVNEGLAHARFIKDNKAKEGRDCIFGWFYDDKQASMAKIEEAIQKYPDVLPGQIVGALVASRCGV